MIIGRNTERNELLGLLEKDESQFCVVYGRRRVGKTYLIRETFGKHIVFQHTGLANATKKQQLKEFAESLRSYGLQETTTPQTWYDAFHLLERWIQTLPQTGKKVIFLDELSWMDTPKSNFTSALEHFWNGWANARPQKDIVLVVCSSATSWLISNVVRNRGGLHNRLTLQLYLKPFSLQECELYAHHLGLPLSRSDIMEAYMVLGGIPYYWSFMRKANSLSQNIDHLFFHEAAPLLGEFDALYASLFKNATPHIAIITALATKKAGMSRKEILLHTKLADNSTFAKALEELEQCNFIRSYTSYGKSKRNTLYQLMDHFTLFYFKYMKNNKHRDPNFWFHTVGTPMHSTWRGLAFERVCLWHVPQIKKALGISGVISHEYSWWTTANDTHDGAQVDLVIDRNDNVINLCEMKYCDTEYAITKEEDAHLRRRRTTFATVTGTHKTLQTTMVTPYGVRRNAYQSNIQSEVVMDDLFV